MIQRHQSLWAATLIALMLPLATAPAALASPRSHAPGSRHDVEKAFRDLAKAQYEGTQAKAVTAADANLVSLGDRLLAAAQEWQQRGDSYRARETAKAAARVYEAARNLGEARSGQAYLSRSYYDAPFRVSRELSRTQAEMAYLGRENATARELFNRAQQLAQPASLTAPAPTTPNIANLATNRAAVQLLKASRHLLRAEQGF